MPAVLRGWRPAWPLACLAVAAFVLALVGNWSDVALRYDRAAIVSGEVWRLVSGHFVHLSASHLWLNLAGLALVTMLFGRGVSSRQWWLVIASSLASLALGFLLLEPQLNWYVGLSGLLHGLILAGAYFDLTFPRKQRNLLALIVVGKLAWEQAFGSLPFTAEAAGGPVVVDAHLYGAIGGFAAIVAFRLREWRRTQV